MLVTPPVLALAVAAALLAFDDEGSGPPLTSRWGTAVYSGFKLGVGHGVHLAFGPRFGLLEPPPADSTYLTPAIAVMVEGDIGTWRQSGMFGGELRVELMCAPGEGLLAPWANLWVSGGGGFAQLGSPALLPYAHLGVGLGGNAFADGGRWGPWASWADWMETLAWPLVLFATVAGLPAAMFSVEARWNFYPSISGSTPWPSVLLGFGM